MRVTSVVGGVLALGYILVQLYITLPAYRACGQRRKMFKKLQDPGSRYETLKELQSSHSDLLSKTQHMRNANPSESDAISEKLSNPKRQVCAFVDEKNDEEWKGATGRLYDLFFVLAVSDCLALSLCMASRGDGHRSSLDLPADAGRCDFLCAG